MDERGSYMRIGPKFWPQGTVYGTLLNSRIELAALGDRMMQAPYKAAPQAPVLYVKPANTWVRSGEPVVLPQLVVQVEIGASIAMVIGTQEFGSAGGKARTMVAGYVLVNDLSLPHASFFRPPVKFNCLDGFLGVGPVCVPAGEAGDPAGFAVEVRINDLLRQTVSFSDFVRNAATLLADVSAFMTLHPGDLLLLGCGAGRPLAAPGDRIDIRLRDRPAFGILTTSLARALPEAA
ncbi:MAG: fumarylacetoacetate hydrolase family protein [Burkholderiaceae bacterium]